MKKVINDYFEVILLFWTLILILVLPFLFLYKSSDELIEYSAKYELVNVKTEIITISENAANVVLVQDIRYTLTYIEDGKPVIFQTYDLNLSLCNDPYIQAVDNWYGGYVGCATKEMMANLGNE